MRTLVLATLVLVVGMESTAQADDLNHYPIGSFVVTVGAATLKVTHASRSDASVWERAAGYDWLRVGLAALTVHEVQGTYAFDAKASARCWPLSGPPKAVQTKAALTLTWELFGDAVCAGKHAIMDFQLPPEAGDQRLGFHLGADDGSFNYVYLSGASSAEESFHGFGLQPTFLDLKGQLVPIWTQEQGITRGRQPYTDLVNLASPGSAGTSVTSYMTAPHYVTNKGRSLFLKNNDYSEIDLRDPDKAVWRLYAGMMDGEFVAGHTPLDQVSAFTEYAGRMPVPPAWFHRGAILGLQGGSTKVLGVLQQLLERGTPVAAVWLQDWVGRRRTPIGSQLWWNWEVDSSTYPDWSMMTAGLAVAGVRVLGYVSPHLVDVAAYGKESVQRNLYAEAAEKGFLVKDATGQPYPIMLTAFNSGMVDFSNPDARQWFKDVLRDQLLGAGLSGWMCDFSEALPPDAVLASGVSGVAFHHDYIETWERLNREAVAEAGRADDVVTFCRAGHTRSPGYASFFWQGDQMVTWDHYDGLRSAVTGLIAGGISGYTLNHSDSGGYADLPLGLFSLKRDGELLDRWLEFSAFTPALRTHEGSRPEDNAQFYSDSGSYDRFDRSARLFASLFFYRQQLFEDAQKFGYPVVRALFLHYPEDARAYHVDDEFLLGSEILVAPVLTAGANTRGVYLPAGEWVHVWSGRIYGDPQKSLDIEVAAPLGQPPVFYRKDSLVGSQWITELKSYGLLP